MLDLARAMRVTENCIRVTADLFPPVRFPIAPEDTLLRLGIDDLRVDLLKTHITGNTQFGLPSLTPPRAINPNFLGIGENSTVTDVFIVITQNAILA